MPPGMCEDLMTGPGPGLATSCAWKQSEVGDKADPPHAALYCHPHIFLPFVTSDGPYTYLYTWNQVT